MSMNLPPTLDGYRHMLEMFEFEAKTARGERRASLLTGAAEIRRYLERVDAEWLRQYDARTATHPAPRRRSPVPSGPPKLRVIRGGRERLRLRHHPDARVARRHRR